MKKTNFFYLLLFIIILASSYFYFQEDEIPPSFDICYAPGNCQTVVGAPVEAVRDNVIGSPQDFHRGDSIIHKDSEVDFQKGRFDERTLFFHYDNQVFWFVNAKILTGFSEDAGLLEGSDALSFEIIDANFARDNKQVYARDGIESPIANTIIEGADPASFETLDFPCSKDKNNYYKFAHIVNKEECQ